MSAPAFIAAGDVNHLLDWRGAIDAIRDGHHRPKAQIGDIFLKAGQDGFLSRAGWVEGVGLGLKTVTVFPGNPGKPDPAPTVQGFFILFDPQTGGPAAMIDGALVTKWKTAADSVLGALYLARPNSRRLLVMGAGALAAGLVEAYRAAFPELERIDVWARRAEAAHMLVAAYADDNRVGVAASLEEVLSRADIISTATSASAPVLFGKDVAGGAHVDLVGAYRPDAREGDDALIAKARLFVDSRETTVKDIGELSIPIAQGIITEKAIIGDLYDLAAGRKGRVSGTEITAYKNGGGAHLDVMVADYIVRAWRNGARASGGALSDLTAE